MAPIKVSILTLAYNHEKYVRRCLDGFVMQKTDFPFEVIIHDDASTDSTAAIIREYEEKYPDIIKPIYQTENQYSKPNTPIMKTFLLPRAQGEYFAFCEGDDWWNDPMKLQKQVDYLDHHPEASACAHLAYNHIEGTDASADTVYPAFTEEKDFTGDDMIRFGSGLFATNSMVLRREAYEGIPDCFFVSGMGDYQMFMYAAMCGKLHAMTDVMSTHNAGVAASWTVSIWDNYDRRLAHYADLEAMLKRVDAYYEGRYSEAIRDRLAVLEDDRAEALFTKYMAEGNEKAASEGACRKYYLAYQKNKRREKVKKALPWLVNMKRKLLGQEEYHA